MNLTEIAYEHMILAAEHPVEFKKETGKDAFEELQRIGDRLMAELDDEYDDEDYEEGEDEE